MLATAVVPAAAEPDTSPALVCVRENREDGAIELACEPLFPSGDALDIARPAASEPVGKPPPEPLFWRDVAWAATVAFSAGVLAGGFAVGVYAYFAR